MGVHQLSKVIGDNAPKAVKNTEIKAYFGRKVAIDASMSIYQFLIAVRQEGSTLMNSEGESTSHLMGMFYRTIRMIENGIKPVYVFEGKPPSMKAGELAKRTERRIESSRELAKAEEEEDLEAIEKFSKRLVKVTPQHNDDCKELLKLMGVPYIKAPGEAEAQCAALAKAGKVYAVGTEDMDALAFGCPVLLRHLTFSEARKLPIQEFNLPSVLAGLELSMDQFVDLCILLGCDYVDTIRGIGPKKAIDLLRKHKSIEEVLKNIDHSKYPVPEDWPYEEAKKLFLTPEIEDPEKIEIKWSEPDEEGLVAFLCHKHGFNEERVRNGAKKLMKAKNTNTQGRIDSFFQALPPKPSMNGKPTVTTTKMGNDTAKKRKSVGGSGAGSKRPK
ncbi:putative flap structure-specific endonuclease [Opisthorchis viverrini]|uniref:Flap endonuclease 1 n=2 Tax=Opisthorchis viverrini TaxID=6198 RepID=A0A1S8WII4_OPIVI|nr:putative flap structure-specific endonuclease [Opisthorchis viverrini]